MYNTGCRLPNKLKSVRLNIGMPVVPTDGRSVYDHVIAEFSRMDRFSELWGFELSP